MSPASIFKTARRSSKDARRQQGAEERGARNDRIHLASDGLPLDPAIYIRHHDAVVSVVPPAVQLTAAPHGAGVRRRRAHGHKVIILGCALRLQPRHALTHSIVSPAHHPALIAGGRRDPAPAAVVQHPLVRIFQLRAVPDTAKRAGVPAARGHCSGRCKRPTTLELREALIRPVRAGEPHSVIINERRVAQFIVPIISPTVKRSVCKRPTCMQPTCSRIKLIRKRIKSNFDTIDPSLSYLHLHFSTRHRDPSRTVPNHIYRWVDRREGLPKSVHT